MMWRWTSKLWSYGSRCKHRGLKVTQRSFHTGSISDHVSVHPRIQDAVRAGHPVVAFESTIITHGMPYPENLKTAQDVEKIAMDHGVLPATIGVLHGKLHVGMTASQLEELASSKDCIKIPKRELVWALSQKLSGGTTVSSTMFASNKSGISVFVTGGIGGVHRGGETTFDVSSDLTELSKTPVCVVSAGVKSILDIPKTLEYLETEGVTVATFGSSKEFPAFYSPKSGVEANINTPDARSAATLIDLSISLGMNSGILIAVPIPEECSGDGDMIERAIQQAVIESEEASITGKAVTPFVLQRVNDLTDGKALKANMELIKNNTMVGCAIAKEFALLQKEKSTPKASVQPAKDQSSQEKHVPKRTFSTSCDGDKFLTCRTRVNSDVRKRCLHRDHNDKGQRSRPVVIGASVVDFIATLKTDKPIFGGATNDGSLGLNMGGVGRNLADFMSRLGEKPLFISPVGKDTHAERLRQHCGKHMSLDGFIELDQSTSTYCLVIDRQGEVILGIGDMGINDALSPEHIMQFESLLADAPLVVLDGNVRAEVIQHVCNFCSKHRVPVWFEPTCVKKATKPFQTDAWKSLSYASPNLNELRMMYASLEGEETVDFDRELSLTDKLRECLQLSKRLMEGIYCLVITLGEDGILVVRNAEPEDPFISGKTEELQDNDISAIHYPPWGDDKTTQNVINVSGAGDCFAAAMMVGILRKHTPDTCIKMGLYAAQLSLQSYCSIPESIRSEDFSENSIQKWGTFEPSRML
ncbi:Pseudouridine-metabolizing bifunctional protein C1861.05 [Holothuria leucospilota]|uniref:Pseudouridine-metabolizing bifunctional protein C1861.05 n=1 Tax=Holothuria leucospilota TaxID=206669 RepID=A0A9Q0YD48_HOLLE|nr:Pseudouridine-metabolizing bifunctional protein C1861.05 [Holothuria leucospilota]